MSIHRPDANPTVRRDYKRKIMSIHRPDANPTVRRNYKRKKMRIHCPDANPTVRVVTLILGVVSINARK
jgi:hypothetical protein